LRQTIASALAYPTVLAIGALLVVALLAGVVIPRFAALLTDVGGTLPATTRALLDATALLQRGLVPLGALVLVGAGALMATQRAPAARARHHARLLALPGLGPLRHALASVRVGGLLGAAIGARLSLPLALELAAAGADDAAIALRLDATRTRVLQGESLAVALGATRAVTPSMVRLIGVGELSGDLAGAITHANALETMAARQRLRASVAVVQPALIVVMGTLVTFVAVALLQAVYGVRPGGP
jgi:type II secretory pathway component PulF